MLRITIPPVEFYDEANNRFISSKGQTIDLEHSLISISKWESKYHKPFILRIPTPRTYAESIDYIKCMALTRNVDPTIYYGLTGENIRQINEYMDDPMTAVWISKSNNSTTGEEITSELIYYWMICYKIPFECQKWHINKLLALIHLCHVKTTPPKKLSPTELAMRNSAINNERRRRLNTSG